MQDNKRVIPKFLKIFFTFILIIVCIIVSGEIIFNNYVYDESEIINSYEIQEEKCQLLKEISKDVIGRDGIKIGDINGDEVQYRIYNDDENIIFYYYLKDASASSEHQYEATITLSKEYDILNEEYSIETQEFEEYKESRVILYKIVSVCYGALFVIFCCLLILVVYILIKLIKNKKETCKQ